MREGHGASEQAEARDREQSEVAWLLAAQLCGALRIPAGRAEDLALLRRSLERLAASSKSSQATSEPSPTSPEPSPTSCESAVPEREAARLAEMRADLAEAVRHGVPLLREVLTALKRRRIRVAIIGLDEKRFRRALDGLIDMVDSPVFADASAQQLEAWGEWIMAELLEPALREPARARFGEVHRIATVIRTVPAQTIRQLLFEGDPVPFPIRSRAVLAPVIWFGLRRFRREGGIRGLRVRSAQRPALGEQGRVSWHSCCTSASPVLE